MTRTYHRIVVKLGTSVLTNGTPQLNRQKMLEIVQQVAHLHQQGHEIVLVSSGAQAAGRERLNFPELEKSLPAKQMLSAVGQGRLMHVYSQLFDIFEIIVGQVLLTRGDLDHRGSLARITPGGATRNPPYCLDSWPRIESARLRS